MSDVTESHATTGTVTAAANRSATGDAPRLRLGVIGAGAWAAFAHVPGFLRRPEIEPWIVNRRDPGQLAGLRGRFGFAHATTDWREVIEARPDLVVLTGPVGPRAGSRAARPSSAAGRGKAGHQNDRVSARATTSSMGSV